MISSLNKFLFGLLVCSCVSSVYAQSKPEQMLANIQWIGQSAIKIEAAGKKIYIDPYLIKQDDKADIILITHSHDDHLSGFYIDKIAQPETMFIAPQSCVSVLEGKYTKKVTVVEPGSVVDIGGIHIVAVPAYNINNIIYHSKANKWVGYLITIDGVTIYHAGDTERIPEMKNFTCDIALLPLGQKFTMNNVQEAADAALDVKAKIAVPIHFGLYEGKSEDAETFKKLLDGKVTVVVKPKL